MEWPMSSNEPDKPTDSGKAKSMKLSEGQEIIIWEVNEPKPIPVHVHRWAWTVYNTVECYDCGAKRS